MASRGDYCTCSDRKCPYHPSNHDQGCRPCVMKNWREREIPSCFFNLAGSASEVDSYHFEDFARYVLKKREDGKP